MVTTKQVTTYILRFPISNKTHQIVFHSSPTPSTSPHLSFSQRERSMQRWYRQVCTSLKEHSYISYAKIASAAGFSDINLIIIKATAPDDLPVHEKYIEHFLKLFSISPSSCHSFAISFTRRFGITRSWRVALKSLILLHRLIRCVPGNSPLRTELLWTRSNGLISLYPCHFKDASSSSSISYTNFITSYAHLLDEALNCVILDSFKLENQQQQEEKEEATPQAETVQEKMKEMGDKLETLPQIQSLIDRVMDCFPEGEGVAPRNFLVQSAMKHIIRDSFNCYAKFRREIVVVLDNLLQLPYRNCIAAFNIYKKASVQTNQLYEFYEGCKAKRLCGSYEYPLVEQIPHLQIKALESFLSDMWQLTESSSSPTSPSSSSSSPSVFTEKQLLVRDGVHIIKGQELEFKNEEEKPLIELEDDDDVSWETLLESSVSFSHAYQGDLSSFFSQMYGKEGQEHADSTWEIATYRSPATAYNPFSPKNGNSNYHGRFPHNPSYPWGL